MTGIIRIGVTEKGSFKKYLEVVHILFFKGYMHNIQLPLTYIEFTVHKQNQLKTGSLVGIRLGYRTTCNFSLMHML